MELIDLHILPYLKLLLQFSDLFQSSMKSTLLLVSLAQFAKAHAVVELADLANHASPPEMK